MNISRIIYASISSMFVCDVMCMSNALVGKIGGMEITDTSKYSVSQYALANGVSKQSVQCASSSNASPMYSAGTTAICKAIARKNAVDSRFACYKQEEIKVKFSDGCIEPLLEKSCHGNSDSSARTPQQAKKLLAETKEFADKLFDKKQLIKDGAIDIGEFTENRIYTGTNVGWICSENSDEFVAKRLFEPAPGLRVLTLLEEWKRKFNATMDADTVKSVLERIKSVEVLSGLLAAAVCDEYERNRLDGSYCQISNAFISDVYSKLNASFFDGQGNEKDEDIASLVNEIKGKHNISDGANSSYDKFNLRNCFNESTMRMFWKNFKDAFKLKKDAIIENALIGLKLYKVLGVLEARLNAIKKNDIASKIRENDDKFYSSFNSNANIEFDNISVQLTDINVDLSLMLAVNAVHASYNALLKKDEIQLNELYSSEIINSFKDVNKEGDTQNINGESLYASVLASKIMERFLYQACYAQYAYSQTPKEFLKMVCDSFFACNFGLKLSNSNFMDIERLKEVLHTEGDKEIITKVQEYHESCGKLETKKIKAARPEDIQKGKLADCMQYISLETINKILTGDGDSATFRKLGGWKSSLTCRGGSISVGTLLSGCIRQDEDSALVSCVAGISLDNRYKTKESYTDEQLAMAFEYVMSPDKANEESRKSFIAIENDVKQTVNVLSKYFASYDKIHGCFIHQMGKVLSSCLERMKNVDRAEFQKMLKLENVDNKVFDKIQQLLLEYLNDTELYLKSKCSDVRGCDKDVYTLAVDDAKASMDGIIRTLYNKNGSYFWNIDFDIKQFVTDIIDMFKEEVKKRVDEKNKVQVKISNSDDLPQRMIVAKFMPSNVSSTNKGYQSLLAAFKRKRAELQEVEDKSQSNALVKLEGEIAEVSNRVQELFGSHAKKIKEYSASTYERALARDDGGVSQNKVLEAIKKYNKDYAVEDIYLSANSSWFFNQCAEIKGILDQIAAQGKSTSSDDEYVTEDDSDYGKVEACIKKIASHWQNLKWLSAHQAVRKNGLAGVELSNLTTTGIGAVLETLLDVPVFSSTKDWVSNSGTKLPEKIDSENSKFICNILSRMHQDICSFFVSRVAATFLCNIFESNKDYSSLTESNAKPYSLILKSFSSSMVDFIADFYKIKECIDSRTGQNIANSSDLLIYAKDCLLSSTTCNKGVVEQVPDDLNKLTDALLDLCYDKTAYCSVKSDGGEFITPMADINYIHFSLKDGVDNVGGDKDKSKCGVLKFNERNEDGMHPLSFVALVDFVRGKINFDQRMILLDSICIPVEGLFEKFQRVTKSGLLGEVPVELTSVNKVLGGGDLGSVINYKPIHNDLQKYHSVFWAESKNPFFVPAIGKTREQFGSALGSTVTVTPPLLYSLKSDSIGDAKAWNLNDLIKKDIFSPQALQILLFLLYKSEDLACVNRVNKSVFYYLSHRERALIADCNGKLIKGYSKPLIEEDSKPLIEEDSKPLIEKDSKPLTSKSVYVYKSPYFSPMFSKSEGWNSNNSDDNTYDIYGEYSPFYLNIGDIGSRSIFGMLETVMYQRSSYGSCEQQPKLGCLGNIIKNVDFYSGDTTINGDSVERLAKRYTNGLFNLPVGKSVSLDDVIFNINSLSGSINQLSISDFFDRDLTHFSDILMFVGSVNLLSQNGGRFSNCQLEILQGTYTPGFTSPKYRDSCSVNRGRSSSLNDINSYKGFLLPAIGMLLTDKTSSFMAEKNYRKYTDMIDINKLYLKDILKGVDSGSNEKDVFNQCFAYGLFANRFRWEHGVRAAAQSVDKGDVVSHSWDVRYTINVQEKLNKLNEIIKNSDKNNENELFLYLADNEPMHIYKIASVMCEQGNQLAPTGIAISKNGENFTYTPMSSYNQTLLDQGDTSTECGFFYISPQIHQYIKQIVVDIYATKNTFDSKKMKAKWGFIDNNEKCHMYAGVLFSLFAGEWKFRLGKYLED